MSKCRIKEISVIIVIIMIIILRIINWPHSIQEMNCDEIMTVNNAVSILETQHDIIGIKNPIYLLGWGGQSVLLLYIMVLSIKTFGYSLLAIRLPLLVVSLLASFIFFDLVRRITKNKTIAQISLIGVLISPWHILQSMWALDCNMFPHFLLFAIYLLYISYEKENKLLLYSSMFCFGLTLYCYGIAMYFTPLFLMICMLYLLKSKKITLKQIIMSAFIFIITALPIIITFAINVLKLKHSIELFNITMPYYDSLTRTTDMLIFSDNIFSQLITNVIATLKTIFVQFDNCEWNSSIYFGTIYHISLIFVIISIVYIIKEIRNKKLDFGFFIMIEWIAISLITGLLINSTNINRLNSIWYALIFLGSFGIYLLYKIIKYKKLYIIGIISVYFAIFISYTLFFNLSYSEQISNSGCFSRGFYTALEYVDTLDKNNVIYTNIENDQCLELYINWQNKRSNKDIKNYKCINNKNDLKDIAKNIDNNTVLILKTEDFDVSSISYHSTIKVFGKYSVIIN